jgi:vault protein inter-alpha-trypsin-like protein/VWA domain-containing protein/FecR-like protein
MSAKDASGTWRVGTQEGAPRRRLRSSLVAAAAGLLVLATGVGASVVVHRYAERKSGETAGLHGKIVRIARSGPDGSGGLSLTGGAGKVGEARAIEGAELAPGSRLTTDALTRAKVELQDGTELVLDRSTSIEILSSPRTVRLSGGQVAIDIPALPGAPDAHVVSPEADVAASGAKLVLTAVPGRTSVEVVRGAAGLTSATGRVDVRVGEEGVAQAGAQPEVTPGGDLARRLVFTERVGSSADAATTRESAFSGLGELVARRPGKTDEKDRALHLSTHAATIRIAANVARTEVLEEFTNDTGDDLEGIYRFPLPAGAQIEKLSLDVDGKMVPGEFVEKAKAAAIWRGAIQNAAPKAPKPKEEIVWVPGPWHDPALLEWNGGGRFELKIFPIPKHGSRRILLGYTETVPSVGGARRYVYALPERAAGTPTIDHFSLDVQVRGAEPVHAIGYDLLHPPSAQQGIQRLAMQAESFMPTGDLTLEYALESDRTADVTAWAYKDEGDPFVALALRPKLPRWEHEAWRDQVIVVDGGHSMTGDRFHQATKIAAEIAQQMDRRDRVTVLVCDVTCRRLPEGWLAPGAPTAHAIDAFVADVTPDGATDLVGAVRTAASLPGRSLANDLRVVLLSSGFGGAGYRRADRVSAQVASALEDARAEVVTVPIGGDADQSLLGEVARGGGGVLVPFAPSQTQEEVAMNVLGATYGATLHDVSLTLPDGFYEAPATLAPIRAGGEQVIALRMRGDRVQGDAVLRGKVGGQPFEAKYPIDVRASNEPGNAFVPRLYAADRIASLERTAGEPARPELVHLSQRYAVPCRYTSLLVLESEAMFQAFGIERTTQAQTFTGENEANASFTASLDLDGPSETPASTPGKKPAAIGFGGGGMGHLADLADKDEAYAGVAGEAVKARRAMPRMAASAPPPAPSATIQVPVDFVSQAASAQAAPVAPVRRPIGRWMRREWFRTASIAGPTPPASNEKLTAARAALAAAPDDRAKHKELARLLALDGSLGELEEVVARWTSRDPLDADAVAARSDILARRGQRDAALRVLSGVLGMSKALPVKDELALERTLAKDYARAGKPEACAFWIAAAELAPADMDSVAHAAACERVEGRSVAAGQWLASLPSDSVRAKAQPLVTQYETLARAHEAASERATWGDLVVDASWDDGADLDIVIIDPSGNRQSWSSRSGSLRVSDPRSTKHETVALSSSTAGPFMIEMVRADGGASGAPVRGRVHVRALGGYDTQDGGAVGTRDFVLTGERAQVARVDVRWDSRLVPTNNEPVL